MQVANIYSKWIVQCHKDLYQNSRLRLEYANMLFNEFIMNRINSELIKIGRIEWIGGVHILTSILISIFIFLTLYHPFLTNIYLTQWVKLDLSGSTKIIHSPRKNFDIALFFPYTHFVYCCIEVNQDHNRLMPFK